MITQVTQKQFEQDVSKLIEDIRREAAPFVDDSSEKKLARVKRALADPFFFAASYFPHYITLRDGFEKECWKNPDAKIDWVKMGFAECHADFFKQTELRNKLVLIAGYSESGKDTIIAKIKTIRKCIRRDIWYHILVASTQDRAASKILPLKLEFEHNERLKSDFGDFLTGNSKNEADEFILNNGVKVHGLGRDQTMRGAENAAHRPDWLILNDIWDPLREKNTAIIKETVEIIKQDYIKRVNTPRWGGILLFNYVSKQSPEHELVMEHEKLGFELHTYRALVFNEKRTPEQREIAHQCKLNKFPDVERSDWEFRHPTLNLIKERNADPDTFDAERQMRPRDKKDAKFKDGDFHFYQLSILKRVGLVCYTWIDPSVKITADYKAIITLGVPQQDLFECVIVNAWIRQASVDEMLEETFRDFKENKAKIVGYEGVAAQAFLEREYLRLMRKYGPLPFYMPTHVESKDSDIENLVPIIRRGTMKFDVSQGDQNLLIRQFKGYPDRAQVSRGGIGDDGIDAAGKCFKLIQLFPPGAQTVEYRSGQKRESRFPKKGAF